MAAGSSPASRKGFVDPVIRDEFPGLRLRWVTVPGRPVSSPRELVRQLRDLSNRYRGGGVVAMMRPFRTRKLICPTRPPGLPQKC